MIFVRIILVNFWVILTLNFYECKEHVFEQIPSPLQQYDPPFTQIKNNTNKIERRSFDGSKENGINRQFGQNPI